MKRFLVAIALLGLLAGCGETNNVSEGPDMSLHQREDGGWCEGGTCYPPWMTKEEVEAEIEKKK